MMVMEKVEAYLDSIDWKYAEVSDKIIHTGYKGRNASLDMFIAVYPSSIRLVVMIVQDMKIPLNKKLRIWELGNELHSTKPFCRLFIDKGDEVILDYSIPYNGDTLMPQEEFLACLIFLASKADELYPEIMSICTALEA